MDVANFIFSFLSFAAVIIAVLLLKNYLPKYAEAKATNQATKEDIGEITDIVEGIKTDLLQQTEGLKAQMSLINQHKIQVKTAEREAFFDYNNKLAKRLYHLTRYSIFGYDFADFVKMDEVFFEINKNQIELDVAEAQLFIFSRDLAFSELKRGLQEKIMEYESIIISFVFEIKKVFIDAHYTLQHKSENEVDIRKTTGQRTDEIIKKYNTLRGEKYGEIYSSYYDMMELIQNRISNIEKEIEEELEEDDD